MFPSRQQWLAYMSSRMCGWHTSLLFSGWVTRTLLRRRPICCWGGIVHIYMRARRASRDRHTNEEFLFLSVMSLPGIGCMFKLANRRTTAYCGVRASLVKSDVDPCDVIGLLHSFPILISRATNFSLITLHLIPRCLGSAIAIRGNEMSSCVSSHVKNL